MKKIWKILKRILFILLGFIVLLFAIVGAGKLLNVQKYKIRSETGVQKAQYITIGGIEQYIQIRGQDISNPVIIMLHGGPGESMAYYFVLLAIGFRKRLYVRQLGSARVRKHLLSE